MTQKTRIDGSRLSFHFRCSDALWISAPSLRTLWIVLGCGGALACAAFGLTSNHSGVAVMTAVFLASLGGSIGGVAFSALCGVILYRLGVDPVRAVQLMMTCSIANQAVMTFWARRDFDWRSLRIFLLGGVMGLPLGLWLLLHVEHHLYTNVLGAFLMAHGGYSLICAPAVIRVQHPALDLVAGALSGITGAAAAFPSAAVSVWCGFKGWDKDRQRAVSQPFILIMQVASLIAVSFATHANGMQGSEFSLCDMVYVPAGLAGTVIGLMVYQRISTRQFAVAFNVLLMAAGLSFLL